MLNKEVILLYWILILINANVSEAIDAIRAVDEERTRVNEKKGKKRGG